MTCSSRHHSQYQYSAHAYAVSAEFERPSMHSMSPQASVVLAAHGGHGSQRTPGQNVHGLISFKEAYSEVGGSYDDCHNMHTTHAWAVLEGVNVADMLTADRVVARVAVYYKADGSQEASYDFTGSYFENLRIAGHPIHVQLDTLSLHNQDTFTKVAEGHRNGTNDNLLLGSALMNMAPGELENLEEEYHALTGVSNIVNNWRGARPAERHCYLFSGANHLNLESEIGQTELEGYGSFICIPKFGVIRLGEITVRRHSRTLRMFRVQMCSSGHGGSDGPTSGGTGGP